MGAPLDLTSRSPFRLRSARTLSTTLLGFEFLQRPQHVLSNFLDRPHSPVLARSTTIASSFAFSLAFFKTSQNLSVRNSTENKIHTEIVCTMY